jgi:hypothetical protein
MGDIPSLVRLQPQAIWEMSDQWFITVGQNGNPG